MAPPLAAECLDSQPQARSVVVCDRSRASTRMLAKQFNEAGYETWATETLDELILLARDVRPDLLVLEPQLDRAPMVALRALLTLKRELAHCRFVILTESYCIPLAVQAVRHGVDGYLVKPATAEQILAAGRLCSHRQARALTLDEAVSTYLQLVVTEGRSISESARRLGVDRRSLRRMLVRYCS